MYKNQGNNNINWAYFWKTEAKIRHQKQHHQLIINHRRNIWWRLINSIFPDGENQNTGFKGGIH